MGFDGTGKTNVDFTNIGWRNSWDAIVVGEFLGNGKDQVLLYDRNAGWGKSSVSTAAERSISIAPTEGGGRVGIGSSPALSWETAGIKRCSMIALLARSRYDEQRVCPWQMKLLFSHGST